MLPEFNKTESVQTDLLCVIEELENSALKILFFHNSSKCCLLFLQTLFASEFSSLAIIILYLHFWTVFSIFLLSGLELLVLVTWINFQILYFISPFIFKIHFWLGATFNYLFGFINLFNIWYFQLLPSGDLFISEISWDDMGTYTCVAQNNLGSDKVESFLYPVKKEGM